VLVVGVGAPKLDELVLPPNHKCHYFRSRVHRCSETLGPTKSSQETLKAITKKWRRSISNHWALIAQAQHGGKIIAL
jgi:hypothetical protein